jgi:hypothetical protein
MESDCDMEADSNLVQVVSDRGAPHICTLGKQVVKGDACKRENNSLKEDAVRL